MWDGNSKLFNLSAESLKQSQQQKQQSLQQVPQNLLSTDPNSPGLQGTDPFGSAMAQQQSNMMGQQQVQQNFKPGVDTSYLMQGNMGQMGNMGNMGNGMGQMGGGQMSMQQ